MLCKVASLQEPHPASVNASQYGCLTCARCCSTKRTVGLPPELTSAAPTGAATNYYQSSGVQKAVTLARYTDLLHGWSVWLVGCRCLLTQRLL